MSEPRRDTIWDAVYEKYGEVLNMTREQVYEMTIAELEQVIDDPPLPF